MQGKRFCCILQAFTCNCLHSRLAGLQKGWNLPEKAKVSPNNTNDFLIFFLFIRLLA